MAIDLETLESMADEPGPESDQSPELLQAESSELQQAEQAFGMLFGILGAISPKVGEYYPQDRVKMIAAAWVPLARKRGWNLGDMLKDWGPEIAFAFAALPPQVLSFAIQKVTDWATGKPAPKAEPKQSDTPAAIIDPVVL